MGREVAGGEAWFLLLVDAGTAQWEPGVGSVGWPRQGELLGVSKECHITRGDRKIIHFHIRGC